MSWADSRRPRSDPKSRFTTTLTRPTVACSGPAVRGPVVGTETFVRARVGQSRRSDREFQARVEGGVELLLGNTPPQQEVAAGPLHGGFRDGLR